MSLVWKSSMSIHWVGPVLLRSVDFFSVYEIIRVILRHDVLWQDSVVLSLVILITVLMETHCHWWSHVLRSSHTTHACNVVLIVVHFEYLLLLSGQILINLWSSTRILSILSSVHHCEAHWTWDKNVVLSILASTRCLNLRLIHEIISMLNMMRRLALSTWLVQGLEMLMMCWWSVLVSVVSDISTILYNILIGSKGALLVMTIEFLNIKTSSSLMRSKGLPSL